MTPCRCRYDIRVGLVRKVKLRLDNRNLNDSGVRTNIQSALDRPTRKCILLILNARPRDSTAKQPTHH